MKNYDAAVIGGGPAGLAAALALSRSGVRTVLAEMMSYGGQLLRQHTVGNYPGFPKGVAGWELADLMAASLEGQGVDQLALEVTGWEYAPEGSIVQAGNERFTARAVLLCTGVKPRQLDVPGAARLTGKGVSSCAVCDGAFFRDVPVAVVGGDDVALHEALYLAGMVSQLVLVCRDAAFTAAPALQAAVRAAANVEVLTGHSVLEVLGTDMVQGVLVRDEATLITRQLDVEGLFVFTGQVPRGGFFPAGLALDGKGFVLTDTAMRTNMPGVFAAGDIRSKHCRQVGPAVGEGITAAASVLTFLEV